MGAPWHRRLLPSAETQSTPRAEAQRALLRRLLERFIPSEQRLVMSPLLSVAFSDWSPEKGQYAQDLILSIAAEFAKIDEDFPKQHHSHDDTMGGPGNTARGREDL